MTDVLEKICADKAAHADAQKSRVPLSELISRAADMPPPRGFIRALTSKSPALIAEVKKASPSRGIIRADFDPAAIARIYEQSGAACLSVLADTPYFQGCDDDLRAVRAAVSLPLLRKDFMIDAYQIYESRVIGADCVLLIMAALSDQQAREFYALATELSLDVLVEVHDAAELDRALAFSPAMVGVNNRNLKTLSVDLNTGLSLANQIPSGTLKVAESGLYSHDDLAMFQKAGYGAFLIGESLLRQTDIGAATRAILGRA
jgi:indole-3-glycerol phosphate synthase